MDKITLPNSIEVAVNERGIFTNVWFLFFEKIYRSLTNLSIVGTGYFGESTIDASAKVQIDSTTRGFLPPRMTTAQKTAISSPAAGLIVYDTDLAKLCVYTGAWETVTSS